MVATKQSSAVNLQTKLIILLECASFDFDQDHDSALLVVCSKL